MGKLTTPEERAAELQARLSGQAPNRTSRKSNRAASTLSNPMFTAALHAASRDAKGAELSPMEARLVQMLKIFATDQEVAEYGKMYTETKAQASKGALSGTIFSGVTLNMGGDTPYTDDDMVADAKAMTGDFLAMPENKIVDISTIDTECVDNSEYMEALTGAGSGITVFSSPKPNEDLDDPIHEEEGSPTSDNPKSNAITNAASEYKMVIERFKCHLKQDDSMFGPKNEIYWAFACGSDVRDKKDFKTGEYGSVESGDVRQMGQTYFQGAVQEHFAGHIECWEADDSGDSFYNKMVQTLKDISDWSIDAAVKANAADDWGDAYGGTGKGAAILALVGICGRLVAALLEWLTNDDDLVFRREIAFTKSALDVWSGRPNGELSFMFDGGHQGKHELWIRCIRVPHSSGILAGWKAIGNTYVRAPAIAGRGLDGISLVNFNNALCGVFRELNGIYYWSKYDGGNRKWSSPTAISNGAIRSSSRPAIATFNDRLYCLYRDQNQRIRCISTNNGSNWTSPGYVGAPSVYTTDGLALCGYADRLIAVHRGRDDRLYWNLSTNGTTWTDPAQVSSSVTTDKSPAICVYLRSVHCVIRHSGRLWTSRFNGISWTAFQDLKNAIDSAPQLAIASTGNMVAMWKSGQDYLINYKECDASGNWSSSVGWWPNIYTSGSPGMANWDGALWVYIGLASV